jgi:beta-lactam-binding protein with PASTA domain
LVAVPDVRGKPEKQATRLLAAQGWCLVMPLDADWPHAMQARPGLVLDQDPPPGEKVDRSAQITIWSRHRMSENSSGSGVVTFAEADCTP